MTNIDAATVVGIEQSELLKAAQSMTDGAISIKELDEPIVLHVFSREHEAGNEAPNSDADDKPIVKIICRNESLEGDHHPITGVPFECKIIAVEGQSYEVVVPQFEYDYKTTLPAELHIAPDREQFRYCNEALKEEVLLNPDMKDKFTPEQIEQIKNGDRPDCYVWHHAEGPGEMQLINKDDHDLTGHTGGKSIWGGGSENR